ncbi:hypothetical protein AJ80_01082 [Polytolypa hystricis UAMH7299]|uniref:Protein-serine/threonine kinase n=1 Tax=Polytolypa hystricis (strain UAMH7299) TaxID=1447883 RepID=A0A2B7YZL5_POLH7|nr:hypothetical protein AJ80_01082 [Polytolypa hystricis UAMH7299]
MSNGDSHTRELACVKPALGTSIPYAVSRYYYSTAERHSPPPWRPGSALDEWVEREIRPISLRQLTFFGRTLTESRLISSANYVRTELPTRLAHRLRDMQKLPYVVVTNPHLSLVYELYYKAFERFRGVSEIRTLADNDKYCDILRDTLKEHLTVIPNLAMGVLECQALIKPDEMDRFMNTLLRARISRRVIAEQHLALTETFNAPWHFPDRTDLNTEFVGEVFLKCNAKEVVERCGKLAQDLMKQTLGPESRVPEIVVRGHLEATFPYILGHLEYIIGELLRNSIQAVCERFHRSPNNPPPIEVLICETPQHVIIRVSDQGGGVPRDILPSIWSFCKGPRTQSRLQNLEQVPAMAATMQELKISDISKAGQSPQYTHQSIMSDTGHRESSLSTLSSRPPDLRLGMGLPMSRVYAEYWAGSLELHSLEGYGVDAFLQVSKLGNKNEQVVMRASIDAEKLIVDHCRRLPSMLFQVLWRPHNWGRGRRADLADLGSCYFGPQTPKSLRSSDLPVMIDVPHQYRPSYNDPLLCASEESSPMDPPHISSQAAHAGADGHRFQPHDPQTLHQCIETAGNGPHYQPRHPCAVPPLQARRPDSYSHTSRRGPPGYFSPHVGYAFPTYDGSASTTAYDTEPAYDQLDMTKRKKYTSVSSSRLTTKAPKTFFLIGPSLPDCHHVADVFRPRFSYYPGQADRLSSTELRPAFFHQSPQVDHLDIAKIWKGLSSGKAEELIIWEATFKTVLESLLQDQLGFLHTFMMENLQPSNSNQHLLSAQTSRTRYLKISLIDLVTSMVLHCREHYPDYRWLASTGNIYLKVAQFVRIHDCFSRSTIGADLPLPGDRLAVGIEPVPDPSGAWREAPLSVVKAVWCPDFISFDRLAAIVIEGQEFLLIPKYDSTFSQSISSSILEPSSILFETPATWLRWSTDLHGFIGIVPFFSDSEEHALYPGANIIHSCDRNSPYTLQIIVNATVIECFDEDVRFEQTLRVKVAIEVLPRPIYRPRAAKLQEYYAIHPAQDMRPDPTSKLARSFTNPFTQPNRSHNASGCPAGFEASYYDTLKGMKIPVWPQPSNPHVLTFADCINTQKPCGGDSVKITNCQPFDSSKSDGSPPGNDVTSPPVSLDNPSVNHPSKSATSREVHIFDSKPLKQDRPSRLYHGSEGSQNGIIDKLASCQFQKSIEKRRVPLNLSAKEEHGDNQPNDGCDFDDEIFHLEMETNTGPAPSSSSLQPVRSNESHEPFPDFDPQSAVDLSEITSHTDRGIHALAQLCGASKPFRPTTITDKHESSDKKPVPLFDLENDEVNRSVQLPSPSTHPVEGEQFLIRYEDKARFLETLRDMAAADRDFLGSDLEDIFGDSSREESVAGTEIGEHEGADNVRGSDGYEVDEKDGSSDGMPLLPPLGVFFISGCSPDFLINICLTLLGYFPGHIHAFYCEYVYYERRSKGYTGSRAPGIFSERIQNGGELARDYYYPPAQPQPQPQPQFQPQTQQTTYGTIPT